MGIRIKPALDRFGQPSDISKGQNPQERALADSGFDLDALLDEELGSIEQPIQQETAQENQLDVDALLDAELSEADPETPGGDPDLSAGSFGERAVTGMGRDENDVELILQNKFGFETRRGTKGEVFFRREPDEQFREFDPDQPFFSLRDLGESFKDVTADISGELLEGGMEAGIQLLTRGRGKKLPAPKGPSPQAPRLPEPTLKKEMATGAGAAGLRSEILEEVRGKEFTDAEKQQEAALGAAGGIIGRGLRATGRFFTKGFREFIVPGAGKTSNAPEAFRLERQAIREKQLLEDAAELGTVEIIEEGGKRVELPLISALDVFPNSARMKEIATGFSNNPTFLRWKSATQEALLHRFDKIVGRRMKDKPFEQVAERTADFIKRTKDELGNMISNTRKIISEDFKDVKVPFKNFSRTALELLQESNIDVKDWLKMAPNGKLEITNMKRGLEALQLDKPGNLIKFIDELAEFDFASTKGGINPNIFFAKMKKFQKSFDHGDPGRELNRLYTRMYGALAQDSKDHVVDLAARHNFDPNMADLYKNAVKTYHQNIGVMDEIEAMIADSPVLFPESMMKRFTKNTDDLREFAQMTAHKPEILDDIFQGWMESRIGKHSGNRTKPLNAQALWADIKGLGPRVLDEFFSKAEQKQLNATLNVLTAVQNTNLGEGKQAKIFERLIETVLTPFWSTRVNSADTIQAALFQNQRALQFLNEEGLKRNTKGLPRRKRQHFFDFLQRLQELSIDDSKQDKALRAVGRAMRVGAQDSPTSKDAAFGILNSVGLLPKDDESLPTETTAEGSPQIQGP